jgi:hypothetical protein
MPPSCSASSAVVSVRDPAPKPYDPTEEPMEEEEDDKKEDDTQQASSFERLVRRTWLTCCYTVYFFVGCILGGEHWYNYIPASIVALIGLIYVALEFVPSIEPPANMRYVVPMENARQDNLTTDIDISLRDADAGWGAEQV